MACCNSHRRPIDVHYINDTDAEGHTTRETITDIAVLPGEIWIGTNNGLMCYSPDMRLKRHFTTKNSLLPHNNIKRILTDRSGIMWIGTNNGVVYLDKNRTTLRRVDTGDRELLVQIRLRHQGGQRRRDRRQYQQRHRFIRAERSASGETRACASRP